ncbi:beta-adaptin [Ordospora colligata]|uniref:Subunit of vesicle coat complex n=1 Tax=Ordospora colligata OC4 TaxID=1354746 RepID=A0A0B2UKN9_9MICR|nr:subunit of vesicle coat complex [Ordospora colligata OC4]KHN69575.1 subunit of vesicle coat complex [Ordospora colligata OC4]
MGVKDAFEMKDISRLFENCSFVSEPLEKVEITEFISSMDKKKQIEGMRSLICRMQRGEDMSVLCNDVMRVIDTRNVEFKILLNQYLVKYTQEWPAKQLMCINTLLKDFGDEDQDIRHSAIEYSGLLGDWTVIKNYINPLRAHASSKCVDTRQKVACSLKNYFIRDPKLFRDEGLCDLLRRLAFDDNHAVSACAINTIRVVEDIHAANDHAKILSVEDINKLLEKYSRCRSKDVLGCLLEVIKNRADEFRDAALLNYCMISCDFRTFYLGSSLAIMIDSSFRQSVFDHLQGFLLASDDELYFVLEYAESLVEHVQYENSCFAIFDSDSIHNKIKKIRLLFNRLDNISIAEVKRMCNISRLASTVLAESIRADYPIEDVFKNTDNTDEVIGILYKADVLSAKWSFLINQFLRSVSGINEKQKYIYLCGIYCQDVPAEILSIQRQSSVHLTDEFIRFYLNMYRRGIYSITTTIENLIDIQKHCISKEKISMVISTLKTQGLAGLGMFCHLKRNDNIYESKYSEFLPRITKSILDVKPYYGYDDPSIDKPHDDCEKQMNIRKCLVRGESFIESEPVNREDVCYEQEKFHKGSNMHLNNSNIIYEPEKIHADSSINVCNSNANIKSNNRSSIIYQNAAESQNTCLKRISPLLSGKHDEENAWARFAESQPCVNLPGVQQTCSADNNIIRLIDTNGLKGALCINNNEISLQVDILESKISIYYECRGWPSRKRIAQEGTYPLMKIDSSAINSNFRLTIGKSIYDVFLDLSLFMKPLSCTNEDFAKGFAVQRDSITIQAHNAKHLHLLTNKKNSFQVGNGLFAFSILGSAAYASHSANQLVIKSTKRVLHAISQTK